MRDKPLTFGEENAEADNSDNAEFAMYCQLSADVRAFFLRCPIESCGKGFVYISGLLGHLRTHQACLSALIGDIISTEIESGVVTLNTLLTRYVYLYMYMGTFIG